MLTDTGGLELAKDDPEAEKGGAGHPVAKADTDENEAPVGHGGNGVAAVPLAGAIVANDIKDLAEEDGEGRLDTRGGSRCQEGSHQRRGVGSSGKGKEVFPLGLFGGGDVGRWIWRVVEQSIGRHFDGLRRSRPGLGHGELSFESLVFQAKRILRGSSF